MESLERSKHVIELGKRLAANLVEDEDLTAEWMAHLIAERIDAVTHSDSIGKAAAEEACVREILRLWGHRFSAPKSMNLLGDVEPVARAIASLDPSSNIPRYYPRVLELAAHEEERGPNEWLDLALKLDKMSRQLIHFCLQMCAEDGIGSAEFRNTLEQVLDAEVDATFELRVVRFVASEDLGDEQEKLVKFSQELILERAAALDQFASLATQFATQLREGLPPEQLKSAATDSGLNA